MDGLLSESRSSSTVAGLHSGNMTVKPQPASSADTDSNASNSEVAKRQHDGQEATKGAIIALSFGIALTIILILFAACRFCRGPKGSWKGRRLNVDSEADYLVDGMYL